MRKTVKKIIFANLFAFIGILGVVNAQITSSEADALLKLAEEKTAFYETDFSGRYTVVQEKPGEGKSITEAIMYRRDRTNQWTILVTGPQSEKGKGYLQTDNNIWFYDPADKRFTFTSAKDKFQNTNANNSDFAPQHYYRDYKIESFKEVTLGAYDCILYTLTAKVNSVDYPVLRLWVTKDDGLVRKKEDYSLSKQLLRTTMVPSYQLVTANGGKQYAIPKSMLIVDNLRGKRIGDKMQYERTQITITNVSFDAVDNIVYTKPYLEMMSK